jgi:hypothetical protein
VPSSKRVARRATSQSVLDDGAVSAAEIDDQCILVRTACSSAREGQCADCDSCAEADGRHTCRVAHAVDAETIEHERVVAGAAVEQVVAGAAGQGVVAASGRGMVPAPPSMGRCRRRQ